MVASNPYGKTASNLTPLAVGSGILIQLAGQPQSVVVNAGSPAAFSVTATSLAPMTYQWQRAEPGTSLFVPISGATGPTYTLSAPSTADSGAVYQCVVSNGATTAVTSANAALFVGSGGTLPADFCDSNWVLGGATGSLGFPCGFTLTNSVSNLTGRLFWPSLISTAKLRISFTLAISNFSNNPPADGFCLVLADPTLGASVNSVGVAGVGMGAQGIPGFMLALDTYQNTGEPTVPYLAAGRSDTSFFANPWYYVNSNIGTTVTDGVPHAYVMTLLNGNITVTMDGNQVFSGPVTVPPAAYLGFTSSTGLYYETTQLTDFSATFSVP